MSKKSKGKFLRATYLSIIALSAYIAMIGLVTYALFKEDIRSQGSRIDAGSLAITAQVTGYQGERVDSVNGMLTPYSSTAVTDINENASPMFNMTKAVPGAYHQVTIKVNNTGDIAFDYSLELTALTYKNNTTADQALAQQIKVTVSYGNNFAETKEFYLADYANNKVNFGSLNKGKNSSFKIKAEFANGVDNNSAKGGSLTFDLVIHAVQKTN